LRHPLSDASFASIQCDAVQSFLIAIESTNESSCGAVVVVWCATIPLPFWSIRSILVGSFGLQHNTGGYVASDDFLFVSLCCGVSIAHSSTVTCFVTFVEREENTL